jgi:hypothetical protein
LAPLSSLASPLPSQSPSPTPRASPTESNAIEKINNSNVSDALFVTIPALLKRLATRGTPKEMKQAVCKAILSICKSPSLKGIDATVPFLGSSKFPLQQRLFILKLLTKEFGLDGEAKVLNCPMVMNIAIDALQDGGGAKKKEKVRGVGKIQHGCRDSLSLTYTHEQTHHALTPPSFHLQLTPSFTQVHRSAVMLIVAASLSVGKERVLKYFRLKKIPEETQIYLEARIEEGEAKRHVTEKKKAKKRHIKEQVKKFKEGEERRQSMADNIFSPDFKSQTTYFSTVGDDDELLFSSASSDDE